MNIQSDYYYEVVSDRNKWTKLLEEFTEKYMHYLMFSYDYYSIFADEFNAQAEAVYIETDSMKLFWPRLIRPINALDVFRGKLEKRLYDATTAYGFGGPLLIAKKEGLDRTELNKILSVYVDKNIRENIVSEFIRFCPLLENHKYFDNNNYVYTKKLNDVVIVDLTKDIEEVWRGIRKTARADIRKAGEKFTTRITSSPSREELTMFLRLYYDTMRRNNASPKYFFPLSFIKRFFDYLNGYAYLVSALDENGVPGSSAIFLVDPAMHVAYYYLSGSNYALRSPPSRLVIWSFIRFIHGKVRYLNLGGGRGKNDSLYLFKRSFSRYTKPYYIGGVIYMRDVYEELVRMNPYISVLGHDIISDPLGSRYFPLYRLGLDRTIV